MASVSNAMQFQYESGNYIDPTLYITTPGTTDNVLYGIRIIQDKIVMTSKQVTICFDMKIPTKLFVSYVLHRLSFSDVPIHNLDISTTFGMHYYNFDINIDRRVFEDVFDTMKYISKIIKNE